MRLIQPGQGEILFSQKMTLRFKDCFNAHIKKKQGDGSGQKV